MRRRVGVLRARTRQATHRLLGAFGRRDETQALDEEMRFHIDMQAEKNVALGMERREARRRALVSFGGRAQWIEEVRDEYRSQLASDLWRDIRYALRGLWRTPGFAASAVLTIALGIAATVTVFGFIDSIFLRPLPVRDGGGLVRIVVAGQGGDEGAFSQSAVEELRRRSRTLSGVVAHYSSAPLYVTEGGESREIEGAVVSAGYFDLLGVPPLRGRFFASSEDEVPDRDAVAVIGEGLWRERFGSDPGIVGRSLTINQRQFTIVGVAPASFQGVIPDQSINEIWIPTMMFRVGYRWCDALATLPPCPQSRVIARMALGATLAEVRSELARLAPALLALTRPDITTERLLVEPATGVTSAARAHFTDLARLLSVVAGVLLVIACANLSGLLLVRGVTREREIALRTSLGATRPRLIRQMLSESLVLAVIGGVVGVALSLWTSRVLMGFFAVDQEGYRHFHDVSTNPRIVLFASTVSAATVALFGLLPALFGSAVNVTERLKGGGGSGGGSARGQRIRRGLVAGQVALSVVLLTGAGLLTRSFGHVVARERFDADHVALLRLRPRLIGMAPDSAQAFLDRVVRALRALPQVESLTLTAGRGYVWNSGGTISVARPGDSARPDGARPSVLFEEIAPDFFSTLRIPLVSGREFSETERVGTPAVAVVNESLARQLWPGALAVDQSLVLGGKEFHVVGVVSDFRLHSAVEAAPPMAFVPFWQSNFGAQVDARLAVRVRGDVTDFFPAARRSIAGVRGDVPVTETLSMTAQVSASFAEVHLSGSVLLTAAVVAIVLSAIGLYGTVAFLVARRTREIGIRLAVGARPSAVVSLFVTQGLRPIAAGSVIGLLVSVAGARALSRWLFGVEPLDSVAFGAALGIIIGVALLASWLPARRAARVSPLAALTSE